MHSDILNLVKELTLRDTKTLSQKTLKLSSETGELASKALAYDNISGDRFRFVSKEHILDEVADVMLVALSIAYSLEYTDEDISSMMKDKCIHWSKLSEQDVSDGKYPFEIHFTVLVKYLQGFIESCKLWGDIKPIVLDLYHEDGTDIQVTTSTVVYGSLSDAISTMTKINKRLSGYGCHIIREKIETVPWHPAIDTVEGKYFESHATIIVNNVADIDVLRVMGKEVGLHISRNVLKPKNDDESIKVMGTLRSSIFDNIIKHNEDFIKAMKHIKTKFEILKTITEYAILDSNEDVDAKWLGKSQCLSNG